MATQKEQIESLHEIVKELRLKNISLLNKYEKTKDDLKEAKRSDSFYFDLLDRYLKIIENLTEGSKNERY